MQKKEERRNGEEESGFFALFSQHALAGTPLDHSDYLHKLFLRHILRK